MQTYADAPLDPLYPGTPEHHTQMFPALQGEQLADPCPGH
jgi:hypothetical protein